MNGIDVFDMPALLGMRRHLSIVHHLPGRIRLRLGAALSVAEADVNTAAPAQRTATHLIGALL